MNLLQIGARRRRTHGRAEVQGLIAMVRVGRCLEVRQFLRADVVHDKAEVVYMWPRRSFSRSFQYVSKRILRLNATPTAVAAGVAAGVFASFFPLGSHFAIAAIVCWLISGNMVAAGLGTFVFGNPLTLPFVVGATWETGKIMLHGHTQSHERPAHLSEMLQTLSISQLWAPVLKPMLCGAVPLGLIFGLLFYGITRYGMTVFREQRRKLAPAAGRHRVIAPSAHSTSPFWTVNYGKAVVEIRPLVGNIAAIGASHN